MKALDELKRTHGYGTMRDADYARLVSVYQFGKISGWFRDPNGVVNPRVTPTDIDSRYLIDRRGNFLWFEFKTGKCEVRHDGQMRAFKELLYRNKLKDVLVVASHPPLRDIEVPQHISEFRLVKWDQPYTNEPPQFFWSQAMRGEVHLQKWIQEWELHAYEKPNSFVVNFRRACGITRGEVVWPE